MIGFIVVIIVVMIIGIWIIIMVCGFVVVIGVIGLMVFNFVIIEFFEDSLVWFVILVLVVLIVLVLYSCKMVWLFFWLVFIFFVVVVIGFCFGGFELMVVVEMRLMGYFEMIGWVLVVFGFGLVIGGILYGVLF